MRKLVHRYEQYQHIGRDNDVFEGAFASLSLDGPPENHSDSIQANSEPTQSGSAPHGSRQGSKELSVILMSMRKIREAVVASARKDTFALRAYTFMIRASILVRHVESYHPALLHLLHYIHPINPLTASEFHEFVGYCILDLSCRQNDLATAYKMIYYYNYKDVKVGAVIKALVHGNWYAFWKVAHLMSDHQQRLLEHAEEGMRRLALDCLGKSYLSVERGFLEKSAQRSWGKLKEINNIKWQLEADHITIRQIKRK